MKTFNIMQAQQRIYGRIIPANAFYGKINLTFPYKVPIKKYRITDKNGHLVFNSDGTVKEAYKTRLEKRTETVVYSIETTKLYKDNKGMSHFIIQLGRFNENGEVFWQERVLGDSALTRELEKFLQQKIIGLGYWSQWDKYKIGTVKLSERNSIYKMSPRRKESQQEMIYHGIPMKNPNDTDVKPRIPIVHTNLDKCKNNTATHEQYTSPYSWEYGQTPKKSGNIEAVAAMNATK